MRKDMNTVRKGWLIKCRHQYPKDLYIALLYMHQSQPIMELVGLSSMYQTIKQIRIKVHLSITSKRIVSVSILEVEQQLKLYTACLLPFPTLIAEIQSAITRAYSCIQ